ncbi:MAG TPA: spore coat U domain-containing protein [Rhodanobacteraceae bacterium]|jgi:spore coat protein U-like protein|nr:spore coat U domain-containing protein [Rhodanobacteraceae bacterium]
MIRLPAQRVPAYAHVRARRMAFVSRPLLAAILAGLVSNAWSACGVSTSGVAFGSYDPFANADAYGAGNIAVLCDAGIAYSIALSPGSGTFSARDLTNGIEVLHYNLYTDASLHAVWGDGAGATAKVGGSGSGSSANIPVYGRIPARQNARVGAYSDNIVVTVTF